MDVLLNLSIITIIIFFVIINNTRGISILSIVQMQNIIWLVAFVLYLLKAIDYYPLLPAIYLYTFEYLLAFNIAYYIRLTIKRMGKISKKTKVSVEKTPEESICDNEKSNRCIAASIIAYALGIGILQKSINILVRFGPIDGLNALRYRTYGEYSVFSTIEMCLITFIIRPIFIVTIILMAEQVSIKKYNIKLIAISLLDAIMVVLMTAGRTMMVSLVFYVFFAVIIINGLNLGKILYKYRKYLLLAIAILIVFINISVKRLNRDEGIIYEIVLYYFSGLPFLSSMLSAGRVIPFSLYGMGTFSPFIDTITLALRLVGISISGGSQAIANITNSALRIGENVATNATASTLLPFVMDYGVIGPVISGFLIGCLCKSIEVGYIEKPSALSYGKYLFLMVAMVTSIQNYALLGVATFTTWVFMNFLLKE